MDQMEQLTNLIKSEIKKQFKSVRRFAIYMGIPQTTIASTLKNGVSGTAYETILRICDVLSIRLINFNSHVVINDETLDIIDKYNNMDEFGKHTVKTIVEVESTRCAKDIKQFSNAAAFGGKKFESVNSIKDENKSAADALRDLKDN